MITYDCMSERRDEVITRLKNGFYNAGLHSQGFALRLLSPEKAKNVIGIQDFNLSSLVENSKYGGFPYLAYLGFGISSENAKEVDISILNAFWEGYSRLIGKSQSSLKEFLSDDVAILGVADGLAKYTNLEGNVGTLEKQWLIDLLDDNSVHKLWSNRLRSLAGDLLDGRGRLREKISTGDSIKTSLELVLHDRWPLLFQKSEYPDLECRKDLLKCLLLDPIPSEGDLELLGIWLTAFDLLIDESILSLIPSSSEIVRLLGRTQHALKRWVWDHSSRRGQAESAHWLIDNESHVQSFLWAVLYPIFGQNLVDEQYLPGYGQVQPRFDIGIISLHLIIEVKVVRDRSDFTKIEEEVAGDLGIYFKNTDQFDRLIVYVYDDCDIQYPERYEGLINSLKNRDRIEDVVIIRRPSMIPNRNQRRGG